MTKFEMNGNWNEFKGKPTQKDVELAANHLAFKVGVLLFLALLTSLSSPLFSQTTTGTTTDGLIYSASSGQIGITGYTGTGGALTISSTITGVTGTVSSIGDKAFIGCTSLTSVTIPNSVNSIGNYTFSYCSGLTGINIPGSVTFIGDSAFYYCTNLASIEVNPSNSEYCSIAGVLFNINQTTLIQYPQGQTGTSYIMPTSVTSVQDNAFAGCTTLAGMAFSNSVTSIGEYAFIGCTGLTSLAIPDSVTSIGEYAFAGCTGLTSVAIPNSLASIDDGVFHNCTGLTSVTIPNGVTSIGEYAFASCTGLTSVTIPASVTSIGYAAFFFCSGLTDAIFQGNAPATGLSVFLSTAITPPFTAYYYTGASGFTSSSGPNLWTDSSGDTYPAVNLGVATSTGSLQVSISPAGAISGGAQWQVDGGAWQASGTTVSGLLTGTHTVAFSPLTGWTAPASQIVMVNANATTITSGTYTSTNTTPWPDATPLGGGWEQSSWFGTFNVNDYPWIYHVQHGYMYVFGTDPSSIWLYNTTGGMGFLWTSNTVYPWLWSVNDNSWLYYLFGSSNPRWFYNWNAQQWEQQNP